jgi:hypothetical protein
MEHEWLFDDDTNQEVAMSEAYDAIDSMLYVDRLEEGFAILGLN